MQLSSAPDVSNMASLVPYDYLKVPIWLGLL